MRGQSSAERLASLDPALGRAPTPPAGSRVLEVDGARGVATVEDIDPDVMNASWGRLRRFELHLDWNGEPSALLSLLARWARSIEDTNPGPDSQASIRWPSRDVAAGAVFLAHGLLPTLTVALRDRRHATPVPVSAEDPRWQIRVGQLDDLDAMTDLWMEQLRYGDGLDPTTLRPSTEPAGREMLRTHLSTDDPWVWVAETDGQVVGMLTANRPEDSRLAGLTSIEPANWLSVLAVTQSTRGGGVGQALAAAADATFPGAGMGATLLHYLTLNPLSVPFWSRQGYRPLWSVWSPWPATANR